ncbi:hypothetical protein BCM18_005757 [Clostridium beijerinckii]|nr:hypothetical protein [Clostridium beijerinckii]MBA8937795.1 hypothetical protein [Clostridium beijerinckii]
MTRTKEKQVKFWTDEKEFQQIKENRKIKVISTRLFIKMCIKQGNYHY